jgi:menaquinone-dependent protoporphyrinogen oxidase
MATEGPSVLVSAASRHGSTAEIAAAICDELQRRGLRARVLPPAEVTALDSYDAVVLGSAVYVGHWLRPAMDLVTRCRGEFADRPVWLFSSGPVGKPSGKLARQMYTDPVELPLLRDATGFREHKIFPGKLSPKTLPFAQRASLLVFRGLAGDFRDWTEVRQWADSIAGQLIAVAPGG